mmetsp:Transcript_135437/g.433170  ORF Transcript_135437/g.433170 Transcript_135437/m.433170 type:complete len:285 (-) Transcript_135437:118-972(-)
MRSANLCMRSSVVSIFQKITSLSMLGKEWMEKPSLRMTSASSVRMAFCHARYDILPSCAEKSGRSLLPRNTSLAALDALKGALTGMPAGGEIIMLPPSSPEEEASSLSESSSSSSRRTGKMKTRVAKSSSMSISSPKLGTKARSMWPSAPLVILVLRLMPMAVVTLLVGLRGSIPSERTPSPTLAKAPVPIVVTQVAGLTGPPKPPGKPGGKPPAPPPRPPKPPMPGKPLSDEEKPPRTGVSSWSSLSLSLPASMKKEGLSGSLVSFTGCMGPTSLRTPRAQTS